MIKIVWSRNAQIELLEVTEYWNERNKSTHYTEKIKFHIELAINLIKRNPKLGAKTDIPNVRMRLILKNYYLVYEKHSEEIRILQFWDVRQNPIRTKYRKE